MLILLTDRCNLSCKHCMQDARPTGRRFMTADTLERTLDVAESLGARIINVAGGEPTVLESRQLCSYLERILNKGFLVILETNGTFLSKWQYPEDLLRVYENHKDTFMIQISAFKEYYATRNMVLELLKSKKGMKLREAMGHSLSVADEKGGDIQLVALGRASKGDMLDRAREHNKFPSCINSALIARQMQFLNIPGMRPCEFFEMNQRFCIPMVDPDGGIHMGESLFCKTIDNVSSDSGSIIESIQDYKPCGKCPNYHWHFDNPSTEKEKAVINIIGK